MPRWANRAICLGLVVSLLFGCVEPALAQSGPRPVNPESAIPAPPPLDPALVARAEAGAGLGAQEATGATTDEVDEGDPLTGEQLKGSFNKLILALGGSPLLVRVLALQLNRYGNDKIKRWARESFFVVDQVVARAERDGTLKGDPLSKAQLFKNQFEGIMKEAGWLEKLALGNKAKSGALYEEALKQAKNIQYQTFQGEVAELEAGGRLGLDKAGELLDVQRRAMMTPRELGGYLLRETSLSSQEVLDLMRTYKTEASVRVQGGRDSHYNATVLELLEPWRDSSRTRFQTKLSREQVAHLLDFQGDVDTFTRTVLNETGLSGKEAQAIVDEYAWEVEKDQAFRQAKLADAATKPVAAPDADAPAKPVVAPDADGTVKASSTTVDGGETHQFKPSKAAGDAAEGASDTLDRAKQVVGDAVEQVKDTAERAADKVKQDYGEALDKLREGPGAQSKWVGGGLQGAKQSLVYDVMRGGILMDVGITAGTNLFLRLKSGATLSESLKGTVASIATVEFLVGNVLGGTLGAAMGAAIPLPAALQTMGLLGRFLGALPTMALTMAGAQVGYAAVSLLKRGQFSWQALWNEVRPGMLLAQILGGALGMTLGGLLGPLGAMLGGMAGGVLAVKLAARLFGLDEGDAVTRAIRTAAMASDTKASDAAGDPVLSGLNLDLPSADDMGALNQSVRDAYGDYVAAQQKNDYLGSVVHFKRYLARQKVLDRLLERGYRVAPR